MSLKVSVNILFTQRNLVPNIVLHPAGHAEKDLKMHQG